MSALETLPQALTLSQQGQLPSVAGAVDLSTGAALAPTSPAAIGRSVAPTSANTAVLAANAAPATLVTNAAASSKSSNVDSYTVGTLGPMIYDCVQWIFTGQRALEQAQKWQAVSELTQ